jgi:transcriptional regulator with XRE-family HTH domain
MAIHEKLRMLRNGKNMSQLFIAHKLDISQNAYSLIESGKTKIDEQRIFQLAKILNVHPFELLVDSAESVKFIDKDQNGAYIQNVHDDNRELIMQLNAQLSKKDEQIGKLLAQIERLSVILDLSQKIDLLIYYK